MSALTRPDAPEKARTTSHDRRPMGDTRALPTISRQGLVRQDGTPLRLVQQFTNDEGDRENSATDEAVARKAFAILEQQFPGHSWSVTASAKKGLLTLNLPVLMGANWVYVIKWHDIDG